MFEFNKPTMGFWTLIYIYIYISISYIYIWYYIIIYVHAILNHCMAHHCYVHLPCLTRWDEESNFAWCLMVMHQHMIDHVHLRIATKLIGYIYIHTSCTYAKIMCNHVHIDAPYESKHSLTRYGWIHRDRYQNT